MISLARLTLSTLMILSATMGSFTSGKTFEVLSQEKLSKCVDSAANLLDINFEMKTEPSLLNDILERDMFLADLPAVRSLLGDDLTQEKPLRPMLDQIHKGITVVHPALGTNLCSVLADTETVGSFSAPNFTLIKRTIHHIFLLDKIVSEMATNQAFMVKMKKHIQATVRSVSPHKSALGHAYDLFKAAGIFGLVKSYTIDGAIDDYQKFRENGLITHSESEGRKRGLSLNVFEATTTERLHGYFSNARAGDALARWNPTEIRLVGEDKTIEYVNNMTYARLYETWNLAFITGNLEFHNLLYPKLLIPSVLLAKEHDYLYHRVLALWLSINFYLMAYLTGKEHVNIPGKEKIAHLMGEINLSYSEYLQLKE